MRWLLLLSCCLFLSSFASAQQLAIIVPEATLHVAGNTATIRLVGAPFQQYRWTTLSESNLPVPYEKTDGGIRLTHAGKYATVICTAVDFEKQWFDTQTITVYFGGGGPTPGPVDPDDDPIDPPSPDLTGEALEIYRAASATKATAGQIAAIASDFRKAPALIKQSKMTMSQFLAEIEKRHDSWMDQTPLEKEIHRQVWSRQRKYPDEWLVWIASVVKGLEAT